MHTATKSLILAAIPWVIGWISYFTFPLFLGEPVPSPIEAGGFTIFHGILDSLAIFIASYILFELVD